MAFARVGTGSGIVSITAANSLSVSYTPAGTGRLLTISSGYWETGTLGTTSIADNLASWTVKEHRVASGQGTVHGYRIGNPSGITTVTINYGTGSGTYAHAWVDEWTYGTTPTFDKQVTNTATAPTNTVASGSLTAAVNAELILGVCAADDSGPSAWNTTLGSWTEIGQFGNTSLNTAAQAVFQIAGATTGPFSITFGYPPSNADMLSNLIAFQEAAGSNTYTASISGGVAFSGAAAEVRTKVQNPSGGVSFAGAPLSVRTKVLAPSGLVAFSGSAPFTAQQVFTLSPSGGLAFAGGAPLVRTDQWAVSGGLALGGAVPLIRTRQSAPAGGVAFGGSAAEIRSKVVAPSGLVAFGGSAPLSNGVQASGGRMAKGVGS